MIPSPSHFWKALALVLIAGTLGCEPAAPDAGATAEGAPPKATAEKPAAPREPATVVEAIKVLDLSTLTHPDGTSSNESAGTGLSLSVKGKVKDVTEHYLKQLYAKGLKDQPETAPKTITEEYSSATLAKGDYLYSISVFPQAEGEVLFNIISHGNVDPRTIPAPAGSKLLYGSRLSTIHISEKSVAETAKEIDRSLRGQGWVEYRTPGSKIEDPNMEQRFYRKNGIGLTAFTVVAPAQGNKTSVQFSTQMFGRDFPIPPGAKDVEYIETPYVRLDGKWPGDLKGAADFFMKELPKFGWTWRDKAGYEREKDRFIVFFDDDELTLVNLKRDEEGSKFSLKIFPREMFEKEPEPTPEPKKAPAVELPVPALPEGASNVAVSESEDEVTFTTRLNAEQIAEHFLETMKADGWEEDEQFKVVTAYAGFLNYHKGDLRINIDFHTLGLGGTMKVSIDGHGIKWKKN